MKKIKPNLENMTDQLNKVLEKYKEENKSSMTQIFNITPKIMIKLLLNFDSFDQTTAIRDVYMPEEKIIKLNVGFIKLNFVGKLRLTADRTNKISNGNNNRLDDSNSPSKTYGVIENKGKRKL
jgi:hypothetical protein